ncbi:MAG TPA: tripartite tricarboxylate transporter substrate binding protein [Xanthobacteraceae bacterium]
MCVLRNIVLLSIAAMGLLLPAGQARAEEAFPSRLVRIIVPFPAGSGTDILARLIADQLGRKWNNPVIVENVTGASGNIGAAEVFRSAPDGHTLMICPPGPIATNRFLFKSMGYESSRWVVISWLSTVPYVIDTRKDFGGTFTDLIERARNGGVTAAIPGPGGTAHLSVAYLESVAGVQFVHVPYRGLAPAMTDIVGGHVDMMFDVLTTSFPLYRQGQIRMVAVASPQRSAAVPEVPTVAETYPGYRSITWFGLVAPPNTPIPIAERINSDVAEVLHRPEVAGRLRQIQMEPVGSTRAEAVRFFAEEAELWGKVIKDAKITIE